MRKSTFNLSTRNLMRNGLCSKFQTRVNKREKREENVYITSSLKGNGRNFNPTNRMSSKIGQEIYKAGAGIKSREIGNIY